MDREELARAFQIAMDKEQEAYDSYMELAGQTADAEIRSLLEKLAREEAVHKKNLMDMYRSLKKKVALSKHTI